MTEEYLLLSPVAILALLVVKEVFGFLKSKSGNSCIFDIKKEMVETKINLALINQKLDNHIEHISQSIVQINANLKKNTDDTNKIKLSLATLKERFNK